MAATVRLKDIVDALDMLSDENPSFIDTETGEVTSVTGETLRAAEDAEEGEDPHLVGWQKEEWETAKAILSSDRFKKLPDRFEVNEWEIMRDFADSREKPAVRDDLLSAIRGPGAFRYFRDTIRRRGLESAWYEFREEAFRQIAIDWCNDNDIPRK